MLPSPAHLIPSKIRAKVWMDKQSSKKEASKKEKRNDSYVKNFGICHFSVASVVKNLG